MFESYVRVAYRSLRAHPGYTGLNVGGLALGMAACLLLLLYVRDELSYDRYHANADRIFRVVATEMARAVVPLAPALHAELPEVVGYARIISYDEFVRSDGDTFLKEPVYFADSTLFELFSFAFVAGDPRTALARPDGIVVTEAGARKYFGSTDVLGRALTIEMNDTSRTFAVTAVLADLPEQSHFRFDVLAPFSATQTSRRTSWSERLVYTYLLLDDPASAARVEAALPALFARHTGDDAPGFRLQALTDIHLRSGQLRFEIAPQGDLAYVRTLAAVAVLVLLIACVNFMNLATARATGRAREVGIRKALGAGRGQLVRQFLGESFLLTGLALVLALGLVALALPAFEDVSGKALRLAAGDLGLLLALALGAGLLAGSYPAFVLSAFDPSRSLKGKQTASRFDLALRRALVVLQFGATVFLLSGTFVVAAQLRHMRQARLGFDQEQVLVVPAVPGFGERFEAVERELTAHPGVRSVSASLTVPGQHTYTQLFGSEGMIAGELFEFGAYFVDAGFVERMGIAVKEGRSFSRALATDSSAFLVNETAARAMAERLGWDSPVGKQLDYYRSGGDGYYVARSGPIVGVVADFNVASLHSAVPPLVLQIRRELFFQMLVRIDTRDVEGVLAFLKEKYRALGALQPFEYAFLDEQFDAQYRNEAQLERLAGGFTFLALFVACLGLFGLAAFTTAQRTKEIGIRKALGASAGSVVMMLVRGYARLVVVAFVVAAPPGYVVLSRWLAAFPYRMDLHAGPFVVAGTVALGVALVTVGYQSVRAALADPVQSLRHE